MNSFAYDDKKESADESKTIAFEVTHNVHETYRASTMRVHNESKIIQRTRKHKTTGEGRL